MWVVNANCIQMTEGDYGVSLPITISGTTLTASDEIKLTIKADVNSEAIVENIYTNIQNNTISFTLNKDSSDKLSVGTYVYSIDWYQDNQFMYNIVPYAPFKVVDKA